MFRKKGIHVLFHKPRALVADDISIMPDTEDGSGHARLAEIFDSVVISNITKCMTTVQFLNQHAVSTTWHLRTEREREREKKKRERKKREREKEKREREREEERKREREERERERGRKKERQTDRQRQRENSQIDIFQMHRKRERKRERRGSYPASFI